MLKTPDIMQINFEKVFVTVEYSQLVGSLLHLNSLLTTVNGLNGKYLNETSPELSVT